MPDKYQALREALATVGDMRWSASGGIVWFDDGDSALIADPAHQKPPVFLAYDNLGAWPEPIAQEDVAKLAAMLRNVAPVLLAELDAFRDVVSAVAAGNTDADDLETMAIAALTFI